PCPKVANMKGESTPKAPVSGGRSALRARRPPSVRDVANVAGVSHQTVSRVINKHPAVRPETRAKVLAAMEVLGYRLNVAARTLNTRRSGILGVVSFDT